MEDAEIDEKSHARLTASIAKLDKTQHIKAPVRSEATSFTGEFDLVKSNRLDVGGVVSVLENSARHVEIGKTLKKTQAFEKVLPKPLEKPQAERIKRSSAFESTKKKLEKWDATVARNRTVDYVSFPLKNAVSKLVPTNEFLSKFKLKSELERELEEVDGPRPEVEEEEEEKHPMTYEEMLEHRQELAKLRAQQSFKAAKAKRQSKIKSKKYHRILKKQRMKQQLAEFEALQKTDPEEALRKLEELEKTRALERHTLRHRNTGKWAKSKLVRAKYNTEVRQQIADQLAVSRSLTKKVQAVDSSDDQSEQEENIPDLIISHDPMNPWKFKNSGKSEEEQEFDFGYKKYVREKHSQVEEEEKVSDVDDADKAQADDSSDNESEQEKNIAEYTIPHFPMNPSMLKNSKDFGYKKYVQDKRSQVEDEEKVSDVEDDSQDKFSEVEYQDITPTGEEFNKKQLKVISTTSWNVDIITEPARQSKRQKTETNLSHDFDSLEYDINKKVEDKLQQMRTQIEKMKTKKGMNKKRKVHDEDDNFSKLEFKNRKNRPIIDDELNETGNKTPTLENQPQKSLKDLAINTTTTKSDAMSNVDTKQFTIAKPKYLASAISQDVNGFDDLDDEQVVPKVYIEQMFEEEDAVVSFRQEKEDEINKDKPEDIDTSLPGWGSWGGKGIKPRKRKKNRFITKAPLNLQRRDENKGDIIIKEFKDPKLAMHKVSELPFPFTSLKDFEASIRAPLGNTFVPEIAHRKLIKPAVFTKAGTIIEPMDDEELLRPRNLNFKNKSVIKLLGSK